jgi:hypothetical protein
MLTAGSLSSFRDSVRQYYSRKLSDLSIKKKERQREREHTKPVAQPQISVFGHSAEASTSIIKMKGDINI